MKILGAIEKESHTEREVSLASFWSKESTFGLILANGVDVDG